MNALRSVILRKAKKGEFHEKRKIDVTSLENSIQQYLNREEVELDDVTKKVCNHITDVFLALGNYDVRFDFDPFSIDDCRCKIVSRREVNMICSLKHVPLHALVIEDGGIPGRVKLKLKDDFVGTMDEVSWEDLSDSTSNTCYLNTTRIFECLSKAIQHAVNDVFLDMANVPVEIMVSNTRISLRFQLTQDDHVYKVNLFPSIRVNNSCENFQSLLKNVANLPETLVDECCFEQGIHVVATPSANTNSTVNENTFWSVTFNDIERRVILSERFECANDCLTLLEELNCTLYEGKNLSNYQLQAIVLGEIFTKPTSKYWKRESFQKRMLRILESLEACLRMGKCLHLFTRVKLFAGMDQAKLDIMAENVRKYRN